MANAELSFDLLYVGFRQITDVLLCLVGVVLAQVYLSDGTLGLHVLDLLCGVAQLREDFLGVLTDHGAGDKFGNTHLLAPHGRTDEGSLVAVGIGDVKGIAVDLCLLLLCEVAVVCKHVVNDVVLGEYLVPLLGGLGEEDLPLYERLDLLKKAGYDGYLSLEWESAWRPELQKLPQDLDYMLGQYHDFMADHQKRF